MTAKKTLKEQIDDLRKEQGIEVSDDTVTGPTFPATGETPQGDGGEQSEKDSVSEKTDKKGKNGSNKKT